MQMDIFFKKGFSHRICQDNACVSPNLGVFLSDGCSSAHLSELGSALLVHAASKVARESDGRLGGVDVLCSAKEALNAIGINSLLPLQATLLSAVDKGDFIQTSVLGDGMVIGRCKETGDLEIINVEFPSSAPFYPPHQVQLFFDQWEDEFGSERIITKFSLKGGELVQESKELGSCIPAQPFIKTSWDKSKFDLVLITSDGIHSFMKDKDLIPFQKVVKELVGIKSTKGVFMQRRCNKMFAKFLKEDIDHFDDFSVGAILNES